MSLNGAIWRFVGMTALELISCLVRKVVVKASTVKGYKIKGEIKGTVGKKFTTLVATQFAT
ncbi:MAG: hypothetical protein KIT80_16160 [Chitinophagaceae bacterium]|nr:hypothetical protein [Chitinophagaceae bacterium]MCW5928451.1 hypothetical protein [Chitinophagaceae bacterium]